MSFASTAEVQFSEVPLPTQEARDDDGVIVLGPFGDVLQSNQTVLWIPDRTVVIDSIRVFGNTDGAGTVAFFKGVGPLGGSGGDTDLAAIETAGRRITATLDLAGGDNVPLDFVFKDTNNDWYGNNVLHGSREDSSGNTVYDILTLAEITATSGQVNTFFQIRYRTKQR